MGELGDGTGAEHADAQEARVFLHELGL
jgi:hypothetical protein